MWYPNKAQWWVIWVVFVVASFLFVGAMSGPDETMLALASCVLVFGGLLVWRLNKKS
jgi:Sec-independent protein secretion pathway component TatC